VTPAVIATWLEGPRQGGRPAGGSDVDLLEAIERGLPVSALERVIRAGKLSAAEADRIVIPRRTLAYRKKHRQRLSLEESDRLARIARIAVRAESTFGSAELASVWLRQPNRALGGRPPLELLLSGEGALLVESVLVRIDDGVYE
jgi:putative toxin-antitoxin system antitoxin component (TIGR02293 family)